MNNTSQHSLTITNQTKGETVKLEHQTSNDTVHSTNGSNGSNGPVPNGGSSGSNGLLVNLLEKNKMVNGVSAEDKKVVVNGSGGGGEVFQAGIKRPASIDIDSSSDAPPASKKLALEGVVCNGVSTTTTTPGGGGGILVGGGGEVNGDVAVATAVSHPTIIPQKQIVQTSSGQHIIVQKPQAQVLQQQILTLADGKKVLVKTPVSTTTTTAPPAESTLTVTRTPSAPAVVTTVNGLQPVVAVNGAAAAVNGSGNSQESNGQNGQMTSLVGRHPSGGATVNPVVTVNNTVIHSSSAAATVSTSPSSSLPGK